MANPIIAVSAIDSDLAAIDWLEQHGATVLYNRSKVLLIELPAGARLERDGEEWHYILRFYDSQGNYVAKHIEIERDVDVNATKLYLIDPDNEKEEVWA